MIPKVRSSSDLSLLRNLKKIPSKPNQILRIEDSSIEVTAVETAFRDVRRQVFWDLHRRCNYDCPYCWPEVHNDYEEVKPYDVLMRTTNELMEKFGKGEPMRFMFGGGEPTIIPKYLEWMKYLHDLGHESVVTTNGSRQPAYFRELVKYSSINMSIHFNFADLDRIVKNVEAIIIEKKSNYLARGLELKIMCPPGQVDTAIDLKKRLFALDGFERMVNWSIVPIRSIERNDVLVTYEDKEFERLKEAINL
jgi:MoaA/NifB/PqqE/SkfB family radical SAM enzyme